MFKINLIFLLKKVKYLKKFICSTLNLDDFENPTCW